jgi:hypothetical protein
VGPSLNTVGPSLRTCFSQIADQVGGMVLLSYLYLGRQIDKPISVLARINNRTGAVWYVVLVAQLDAFGFDALGSVLSY